jgi:hypothetical protein
MNEEQRDFLKWLMWHPNHDQWEGDRLRAFRTLLEDARTGAPVERAIEYGGALTAMKEIVSAQELMEGEFEWK